MTTATDRATVHEVAETQCSVVFAMLKWKLGLDALRESGLSEQDAVITAYQADSSLADLLDSTDESKLTDEQIRIRGWFRNIAETVTHKAA